MIQAAALQVIKKPAERRKFVLPERERKAYRAAHRIMAEATGDTRLASSGTFHRSVIDDVARIIVEEFGGAWKP